MKLEEFTDQELSFISLLMVKVDPMKVIEQAVSINEKINIYAQKKNAEAHKDKKRNGAKVKR